MAVWKVCSLQECAERFKSAMADKGITASELSRMSGVPRPSISQYTTGRSVPSNLYASKIGEVLGVSPTWLMGFDTPREEIKPDKRFSEEVEDMLNDIVKLSPDQFKRLKKYLLLIKLGEL